MKISMIACVGKNLELGKNNDLIWHLPNDLKYFKKVTTGKSVLMGLRTFYSLPKILPNRKNIVLTLPSDNQPEGVEIYHSIDEFLNDYKGLDEEVFIIGGASIYRQFLPYASNLYLTEVDLSCDDASVFFPSFIKEEWDREIVGEDSDNDINYKFVLYRRKK